MQTLKKAPKKSALFLENQLILAGNKGKLFGD